MITSADEYERMAFSEERLWWYRILHEKAIKSLSRNLIKKTDLIVDMGCGTGGLLKKLQEKGYLAQGVDCSDYALHYCREKNLLVTKGDILDIKLNYLNLSPKVLIFNDSLCYFSAAQIREILKNASEWLPKGGLIILNFPTFKAFSGAHDISVGIKERLTKPVIEQMLFENGFTITKSEYWPFLLSPLILIIRSFQRVKMKYKKNILIKSDVNVPAPVLNNLFYYITKLESQFTTKPLGSSCFITAKNKL